MLLASVADACNSYDIDSSSLLEVLQKDPFKQESVGPEDEPVEPAAKIAKRSQLSPLAQQMRQSLLIQLHGDVNQPSQARREPGGRAAKIPKGSVGTLLMSVAEPGRYVFLPNMMPLIRGSYLALGVAVLIPASPSPTLKQKS